FKKFRSETYLRNPQFRLGMQFVNIEEVKEAIKEYAIVEGKSIKFGKHDSQ
ncbi:PREDICTED: LOC110746457, partial [Prunus dulcis]